MTTMMGGYLAYLLRIWQIKDDGQEIWHASLEDPHTGKRQGFPNLDALIAFLWEQIGDRQGEGETSQDNEGDE